MVQWLKDVWKWVVQAKPERQLSYNRDKLSAELHNLSEKIYEFRNDVGFNLVKEVIETAKNIAILETALYSTNENQMWLHKGRFQAFGDLTNYLDTAIAFRKAEIKDGKPKQKRSLNVMNRTNNQAGAAI